MPSFLDTNILIHTVDPDEPEKSPIAAALVEEHLVEEHLVEGDGRISVQVLSEFYSASRKLSQPLSDEQADEMVRYFATFSPLPKDARMVLGAVRRGQEFSAGANRLLTQDLQNGQEIEGLHIENPFL